MSKLIITAALTGAEVTRDQQPHLPITPEEIGQAALEAYEAGAAIVHVHARQSDGSPTQDKAVYAEIKRMIESRCPVIFQPSTGGATWHSAEERLQPVELNPEMATLSTGTCNFGEDIFSNPQRFYEQAARMMLERGVKPEFEVFEAGMIDNAMRLVRDGLVKPPLHFNFVLGVPGAMSGSVRNLCFLVDSIPKDATWTVSGIGRHETPLAMAAIAMGGHVRVGFEDNIYFYKGQLAKGNAELTARIARLAKELGREVATPDEAREILGLPARKT
ncbi:MAG: 3-keto-5-aminohexanoate cleavage protein [Bacillota bacterium]|nr:3-keto-5-aminohexanoate cleavage protein [Bacillota bacterium]NLJ03813.1 3-keto-5-aminohexanoate cleavage protein [Bacillota bacterium]